MTTWDDIRKRCPRLYRNGMIFECGIGWCLLILDLSLKIEKILEREAEAGNPDSIETFAVQVKEKYGMLRFYMSQETDEICELVREAEAASSQMCEQCGCAGKMRGNRWIEVSCDKCFKQREEDGRRATSNASKEIKKRYRSF